MKNFDRFAVKFPKLHISPIRYVQAEITSITTKNQFNEQRFYFLILLIVGCSTQEEKSEYEKLLDYEGTYEYVNQSTLDIVASEADTTLKCCY